LLLFVTGPNNHNTPALVGPSHFRTHHQHPPAAFNAAAATMSFTGSLQPKKKSELQEIAIALDISDSGTREELQNRIKHHLAQHEHSLADDPRFGGLYVRATRKRSVQPTMMAT